MMARSEQHLHLAIPTRKPPYSPPSAGYRLALVPPSLRQGSDSPRGGTCSSGPASRGVERPASVGYLSGGSARRTARVAQSTSLCSPRVQARVRCRDLYKEDTVGCWTWDQTPSQHSRSKRDLIVRGGAAADVRSAEELVVGARSAWSAREDVSDCY